MTPIVEILRISKTIDGTFGVLLLQKAPFCVTLELPWRENIFNVSCIPDGQYYCRRVESPNFGDIFQIEDVPGRENILLGHVGNTIDDTRGCVLFGESFGKIGKQPAIMQSSRAVRGFMAVMGNAKQLHLTIREVF